MKLKLFAASFVLTLCALLAFFYYGHRERQRIADLADPELDQVAKGMFVTGQLKTKDLTFLQRQGVKTLVDCRPDGEAYDQTSSREIELAAKSRGMDFYYIPVPHGNVPGSAVKTLGDILAQPKTPVVLYCRTGNRAVRTLALVQASRPDGPNADAIVEMVQGAGFSADDLKADINQRIANRNNSQGVNK